MKKSLFTVLLLLLASITFSQKNAYQLSTHILDISKGAPAAGVSIRLEKQDEPSGG